MAASGIYYSNRCVTLSCRTFDSYLKPTLLEMLNPDDLDKKQQVALQKLRELLTSDLQECNDDYDLLRWLTARNFVPEKAAEMFKKNIAWRRTIAFETTQNEYVPPEVCVKYLDYDFTRVSGYDKDGSIIRLLNYGRRDMKGVLHSVKKSDVIKFTVYLFDGLLEKTRKNVATYLLNFQKGPKAGQIVFIADMDGFGMDHFWKPGLELNSTLMALMEANYPEIIKRVFVINAPALFPVLYAIISPFMSAKTTSKIKVYGRKYQSALLKYIDADQLPVYYGGTKRGPDGDPKCSDVVCYAGKVPSEYYTKMDPEKIEGFTEISVNRGASIDLEFYAPTPQSVIRYLLTPDCSWQFVTEGYDVGFGVLLKTQEGQAVSDMTVVKETERVSSHIVPEDGHITCDVAGTYVLRFDNTYSWARAKKILYTVDILEPSAEIEILECTHL